MWWAEGLKHASFLECEARDHTVQVCTRPALCSNRKPSPPSLGALPASVGQGRFVPASVTVTIHSHGLCRYRRWACRPVTSRASQPSRSSSLLPGTRRLQNSPRHPGGTWSGEEHSPCPPSRPAAAAPLPSVRGPSFTKKEPKPFHRMEDSFYGIRSFLL